MQYYKNLVYISNVLRHRERFRKTSEKAFPTYYSTSGRTLVKLCGETHPRRTTELRRQFISPDVPSTDVVNATGNLQDSTEVLITLGEGGSRQYVMKLVPDAILHASCMRQEQYLKFFFYILHYFFFNFFVSIVVLFNFISILI